ncbi:unnamed protein product [Caenorhabditis brenneri]
MPFPLLRLPLLASTRIIKITDLEYLITLIQLSKRAKNLVKLSKVQIELTVSQFSIQFQKLADEEMVGELYFFDLSAKPTDIPFKPPYHLKFDRRIQYQIGAYKKVLDDFVKFFNVCFISFELETVCSYTSFKFMEHAKDLGLQFSTARVVIDEFNGKVHQNLLKICCNASQLIVLFEIRRPFNFQGFTKYKTYLSHFNIERRDINWFTVDRMCSLVSCSKVFVKDLDWSSEDMNRFLKFWITCDGRLKSFDAWKCNWGKKPFVSQVVMHGIDHRELRYGTFEIQRADGVKAKVECYHSTFTLTVI